MSFFFLKKKEEKKMWEFDTMTRLREYSYNWRWRYFSRRGVKLFYFLLNVKIFIWKPGEKLGAPTMHDASHAKIYWIRRTWIIPPLLIYIDRFFITTHLCRLKNLSKKNDLLTNWSWKDWARKIGDLTWSFES